MYSQHALQQWCQRIDGVWENGFGAAALRLGQRLYKKGAIREISLNDDDAIMTCRIGKQDSYSVVEWDGGKLSVRSSTSDAEFGEAIAVAGLLEIEELIADEDLNFLAGARALEAEESDGEPDLAERRVSWATSGVEERPRMLHLVLDTHFKGLICEAYWMQEDGSRVPALRAEDGAPRANGPTERERLILLAARARKSHFVYSAEFAGYLLENVREVSFFIRNVWPSWKKWFSTEERENVRFIQGGLRELVVEARADLTDAGKLDMRWVLDSGQQILTSERMQLLLEQADEPKLIPDLGLVKLSEGSKRLLQGWMELESEADGGILQAYQLFSLFAEQEDSIEFSDRLAKWREALLKPERRRSGRFLDCLRAYQEEGVRWMARLLDHGCHCLLADEMGLGKTVQVIALIEAKLKKGQQALIVCPASVVPVWIAEFAKFAPRFRVKRYERSSTVDLSDCDVQVISFALLRSRIERVAKRDYEFAVVDEAQFIKNPDAKASRSCRRIRANRRIALTGTPIENRPLDIWPAFQFLMPGLLGSRSRFEKQLNENPGAFKARLRLQIAPFMLRRTKRDVAKELPEKTIIDQGCPVTPRQAAEYSRICSEGLKRLGDDIGSALRTNRFAALSLLTRLRQASCDPDLLPWVEAKIEDSGKLMVLLERLIEVLGTGHKVVIFSQFVRFLERARHMIEVSFPELPIFELTGATRDREQPVQAFQDCKETAAMLVSLKAASVGITLHSADYVFILDPWWNPAVENQAIDRVHRIGQRNRVFVYRLIAEGTIEERIRELQREKSQLFEQLIEGGEEGRSGLDLIAASVKSLEALLTLAQS